MKRNCDGCTACCDGWLNGQAHGHGFWPGRKCHFVGTAGCSIYSNRPDDPCKSYKCEWLINEIIPEWMKPDQCKVILTTRKIGDIAYIEAKEAGHKLDSSVLSWLVISYLNGIIENVSYEIAGGWNHIGSKEFIEAKTKVV